MTVDYNSPAWHEGYAAGRSGQPTQCPYHPGEGDDNYESWVEGWLMGDAEKDIPGCSYPHCDCPVAGPDDTIRAVCPRTP